MNEVVNLQRTVTVDTTLYEAFVNQFAGVMPELRALRFTVAFIDDSRMEQLNATFRGKSGTTDVLSFPNVPEEFELPVQKSKGKVLSSSTFLGDIVISAEQAQKQAKENKLSLEKEIKQLILHGLLHLCGYDHETDEGEMNRRELELRESLEV